MVVTPARVLALLCTAQVLVIANLTLVTTALPAMQGQFGSTDTEVRWVLTTYALVFGVTLLPCGRLGDRRGHRAVFRAGLGLFAVGSVGCGLAWQHTVLVIGRGLQGIGAAAVAASALAVLMVAIPAGRARTRALGLWSAAQAGGGAAGWLLGGVVTEMVGWQWLFLGNVPLATLGLLLAPRLLPATERRSGAPVLPALRDRPLIVGAGALAMINAVVTGVLLVCSLYLHRVAGLGAALTGMLFVPFNLAVIAGAWVAGRRPSRSTGLLAAGLIATGVAVPLVRPDVAAFVIAFVALGLGGGAASVLANATGAASRAGKGLISGVLNTAAELGAAIGTTMPYPVGR